MLVGVFVKAWPTLSIESFAKRRVCHSRGSHRESSPRKIKELWIPVYAGMTIKPANGSFCKRLNSLPVLDPPPFTRFLVGHAVADMINTFEGRDDLFIMGDDDDGGLKCSSHIVQNANHG